MSPTAPDPGQSGGLSSLLVGLHGAPNPNSRSPPMMPWGMKKMRTGPVAWRSPENLGNSGQAREEHLLSSHQEIGGSVLGNQAPSAPSLEETMARRKVTAGELQKIKKRREIKERKNKRMAELEEEEEELDDGSVEEYDVCVICDDGGSVTW
ncbi:unnamed protein product [Urochloa humidicola]